MLQAILSIHGDNQGQTAGGAGGQQACHSYGRKEQPGAEEIDFTGFQVCGMIVGCIVTGEPEF